MYPISYRSSRITEFHNDCEMPKPEKQSLDIKNWAINKLYFPKMYLVSPKIVEYIL